MGGTPSDRTCPECGRDRVLHWDSARRVYSDLESHERQTIDRTEHNPHTDLLCSWCWTEIQ